MGVSWGLQEIQMMTVDLCIDCGKVVPGKLPGKFRKRDMAYTNSWLVGKTWVEMKCMKCMNWHEWIEMNELKGMNWHERLEMNELKGMNWDEWIEMNELNELKWIEMNWNKRIETNELKWMNEMNEFKWMNWPEWIDMNGLKRMDWNEWIERNEWPKVLRTLQFFYDFNVKSGSCCSLVHILSTTFSDRSAKPQKQRPSSGDHGQPSHPKKHRVLRPRVFSSVNSCVPDRWHLPTTWWWCGWHDHGWHDHGWHGDWDDDVVAVMARQLAIDNCP